MSARRHGKHRDSRSLGRRVRTARSTSSLLGQTAPSPLSNVNWSTMQQEQDIIWKNFMASLSLPQASSTTNVWKSRSWGVPPSNNALYEAQAKVNSVLSDIYEQHITDFLNAPNPLYVAFKQE